LLREAPLYRQAGDGVVGVACGGLLHRQSLL
jgi:hypothetical protein